MVLKEESKSQESAFVHQVHIQTLLTQK